MRECTVPNPKFKYEHAHTCTHMHTHISNSSKTMSIKSWYQKNPVSSLRIWICRPCACNFIFQYVIHTSYLPLKYHDNNSHKQVLWSIHSCLCVAAYFKHPSLICSPYAYNAHPGKGLYIQMGYNVEHEYERIPLEAHHLSYEWKRGNCIPKMGMDSFLIPFQSYSYW